MAYLGIQNFLKYPIQSTLAKNTVMHKNFRSIFFIAIVLGMSACNSQDKSNKHKSNTIKKGVVGGPFENGEFMYFGIPENINSIDTSAAWNLEGQKLLVRGKITKIDGKTPAPDVILYYYQTDTKGYYSDKENLDPRVRRHGYIRGWVKSDVEGNYAIYTVRPAPYPNLEEPAHIHIAVKEPDIDKEYYLDALVFDDDPLLTTAKRKALTNRGGSGVLRPFKQEGLQIAAHNVILGLNIPNYPGAEPESVDSGINVGEDVLSFTPFHAWGPDKGSKTCPICKYGKYHGILFFVGRHPDWKDIKKWLVYFETESKKRKKFLKVYLVYGNDNDYDKSIRSKELEALGNELNIEQLALTLVPSFNDTSSEIDFLKINPDFGNTILIYKNSNVIEKYIDLKASPTNFGRITARLDATADSFSSLSLLDNGY